MDEESMTASGGNLIDSEINRNEQSAQRAVAMIEVAETCYPKLQATLDTSASVSVQHML